MKIAKRFTTTVAIFVFLIAGLVRPAQAVLTLYLQPNSGSSTTVIDGDLDGSVSFAGTVGNFNVLLAQGIGPGTVPQGQLIDLFSMAVSSSAGGSLTVRLADINFADLGNLLVTIGGTVANGLGSGQLTWKLYRDIDNSFAINNVATLGNVICSGGPFGDGGFTQNTSDCFSSGVTPYSLTLEAVIAHVGAATTSFDYSVEVPEPAALVLLGVALIGLAAWGRRRVKHHR